MSEVMKLICPTLQMRNSHGQKPNRPREQLVVMADDFDRVTAERDAALEEVEALKHWRDLALQFDSHRMKALWHLKTLVSDGAHYDAAAAFLTEPPVPPSELQQRLTAAGERNDNRDSEIFAQVQSALRRSFSLGQIYWQQADSDSTYQQNKSDQTMEVQEQHILNVLKSLGAALKPAEVGADSCEFCKGWGFRSNPDGADEGCGACNGTGKEPSDDQQ